MTCLIYTTLLASQVLLVQSQWVHKVVDSRTDKDLVNDIQLSESITAIDPDAIPSSDLLCSVPEVVEYHEESWGCCPLLSFASRRAYLRASVKSIRMFKLAGSSRTYPLEATLGQKYSRNCTVATSPPNLTVQRNQLGAKVSSSQTLKHGVTHDNLVFHFSHPATGTYQCEVEFAKCSCETSYTFDVVNEYCNSTTAGFSVVKKLTIDLKGPTVG